MRIIKESRFRHFWADRTDAVIAEKAFRTFVRIARDADWENTSNLKRTFRNANQVGNCVVFDVGSNKYRVIGRINYRRKIIYVLAVMDHGEYDRQPWAEDCGCRRPPPSRP